MCVKAYNSDKHFSTIASTVVKEISKDDVQEVVPDDVAIDVETFAKEEFLGKIVGVESCNTFLSCLSCSAKVVEINSILGRCQKCGLRQKMSRCKRKSIARVMLQNEAGVNKTVAIFDNVMELK